MVWFASISVSFKGTLMQICKSHYMLYVRVFIKTGPRILRILGLFTREVCKFFKKQANFYYILLLTNFSHISRVHISKSSSCFDVKSSAYSHMETKILADFWICISVTLSINFWHLNVYQMFYYRQGYVR